MENIVNLEFNFISYNDEYSVESEILSEYLPGHREIHKIDFRV